MIGTKFIINKTEYEENLNVGSYLLSFNEDFENHLFVNFKSEEDVHSFVTEHTSIALYDKWLNFIGNSEVYASEIENRKAYICKVLSELDEKYTVEIVSIVR